MQTVQLQNYRWRGGTTAVFIVWESEFASTECACTRLTLIRESGSNTLILSRMHRYHADLKYKCWFKQKQFPSVLWVLFIYFNLLYMASNSSFNHAFLKTTDILCLLYLMIYFLINPFCCPELNWPKFI